MLQLGPTFSAGNFVIGNLGKSETDMDMGYKLLAEAKNKVNPGSGERLEALTKKVMVQPPEVIERIKKLLGI